MNEQEPQHESHPPQKPQSAREFIGRLLRRFNINADIDEPEERDGTNQN